MKHILSVIVALCATSFSFAQQNLLDSTYSGDGKDMLTLDTSAQTPQILLLPNGKSIVATSMLMYGNSFSCPLLIRYNEDGSIDSTFGVNGIVSGYMYGNDTLRGFNELTLLSSGKLLFTSGTGNGNAALFRVESNGTIDPTFGTNGAILFPSIANGGIGNTDIYQLSNNKILAIGHFQDMQDSVYYFKFIRYTEDGQIDSSYANNGYSNIPRSNYTNFYYQRAHITQYDEVILSTNALFSGQWRSMFFKIDSSGLLDSSFANGSPINMPMLTYGFIPQPNGKLLITGALYTGTPKRMTMRLNANGTLDNSFNGIGYKIIPNNTSTTLQYFACDAFLTNDNRIITGYYGTEDQQGVQHMGIGMLRTDGTLENLFGTNGSFIVEFPTRLDNLWDINYDNITGKVVMVGVGTDTTQNNQIILLTARINIPAIPCTTTQIVQNISLCAGSSYSFNDLSITQAGTYVDTLQTVYGCDSIINLNVTVLPLPTQTQNILLCPGESTTINGISYSQNAIVIDTVNASTGCDTIKTYYINTIPASEIDTFNFYKCEGDTLLYKGNIFTTSGAYQDTMTSVNGCDSIERITFVFFAPPQALFSITPDAFTPHNWYAVNQSTGDSPLSYTWYWGDGSSDTGSAASHTYTSEGYYNICLEVTTDMGCSDIYCDSSTYIFKSESTITINVVNAIPTGINEAQQIALSIIPNPTSGMVNISTDAAISNYILTDNIGKILLSKKTNGMLNQQLDISNYSNGVYLLRISDSHGNSVTKRVLKQ
jgi:uncharacterized delta-60 repeat protein